MKKMIVLLLALSSMAAFSAVDMSLIAEAPFEASQKLSLETYAGDYTAGENYCDYHLEISGNIVILSNNQRSNKKYSSDCQLSNSSVIFSCDIASKACSIQDQDVVAGQCRTSRLLLLTDGNFVFSNPCKGKHFKNYKYSVSI